MYPALQRNMDLVVEHLGYMTVIVPNDGEPSVVKDIHDSKILDTKVGSLQKILEGRLRTPTPPPANPSVKYKDLAKIQAAVPISPTSNGGVNLDTPSTRPENLQQVLQVQDAQMRPLADWIKENLDTFVSLGVKFVFPRHVLNKLTSPTDGIQFRDNMDKLYEIRTARGRSKTYTFHQLDPAVLGIGRISGVIFLTSDGSDEDKSEQGQMGHKFPDLIDGPSNQTAYIRTYGISAIKYGGIPCLISGEIDKFYYPEPGAGTLEPFEIKAHAETSFSSTKFKFNDNLFSHYVRCKVMGCKKIVVGVNEGDTIKRIEIWDTEKLSLYDEQDWNPKLKPQEDRFKNALRHIGEIISAQ